MHFHVLDVVVRLMRLNIVNLLGIRIVENPMTPNLAMQLLQQRAHCKIIHLCDFWFPTLHTEQIHIISTLLICKLIEKNKNTHKAF